MLQFITLMGKEVVDTLKESEIVLTREEERILQFLYPDKLLGLRKIADKLPHSSTTSTKRMLAKLCETRYVVLNRGPHWKRGKKTNYRLTEEGRKTAGAIMVGERGKELFIDILKKLQGLAKKPGGGEDEEIQLTLDIYELIDTPEAGEAIGNVVEKLLTQFG